jgi:hypothetical protein
MRAPGVLFFLLGILGGLCVLFGTTSAVVSDSLRTRERIEADLRLWVELKGSKTIQAGTTPWLSVALVNTSTTPAHWVVKYGDGSEVGWREPYVYWTATLDRGDGKLVPVPRADYRRCGLFNAAWPKDAILLRPGEKMELGFVPLLEFQQPGRVRLRAHYAYHGGSGERSRSPVAPDQRRRMTGVPAFEVISDPLEFDVIRPLDIRVKVKWALKAKVETRLSDLVEVVLVNQSADPVTCSSPTLHAGTPLRLEIDGEYGGWPPTLTEERSTYGVRRQVKPGESVPLLGPGEFANGMDGTWTYPKEGKVRLRAVFLVPLEPWHWARIQSEWVEVRVIK